MAEERKRYLLRVSERQLAVIQKSLEEYFRLRMGQDYCLSEEMAEFKQTLREFPRLLGGGMNRQKEMLTAVAGGAEAVSPTDTR